MADIGKWPVGAGGDPSTRQKRVEFNATFSPKRKPPTVATFSDAEAAAAVNENVRRVWQSGDTESESPTDA